MVDRTAQRGYSYPECDPPTVKDRSDIDYLRELAVQVNNDVAALDFKLQEFVEKPDAARIFWNGNRTTTGAANGYLFIVPYDSTTYFNAPGIVDLGANGFRIQERGWYMFVSYARCTNGGEQSLMVRHARNGQTYTEGRRLEGPSSPIDAGAVLEENMTNTDVMFCNVGDLVTTQLKVSGVGGTFAFQCRFSMLQLVKLDV